MAPPLLYHGKLRKIDLAVLHDWDTGKTLIGKQLPTAHRLRNNLVAFLYYSRFRVKVKRNCFSAKE